MALIHLEELGWCLTVVVALTLIGSLQDWVIDCADIEITFFLWRIRDLTERIQRHDGFLVSLLATENVVNPRVQVVGDILGLDALSHHLYKLESILICPFW